MCENHSAAKETGDDEEDRVTGQPVHRQHHVPHPPPGDMHCSEHTVS